MEYNYVVVQEELKEQQGEDNSVTVNMDSPQVIGTFSILRICVYYSLRIFNDIYTIEVFAN